VPIVLNPKLQKNTTQLIKEFIQLIEEFTRQIEEFNKIVCALKYHPKTWTREFSEHKQEQSRVTQDYTKLYLIQVTRRPYCLHLKNAVLFRIKPSLRH